MDKSTFPDRLRDALTVANVHASDIAKDAKVSKYIVYNTINGHSRPRKRAARALTGATINAINAKLRDKANDINELRNAGNELREAYKREYEHDK